MAQKTPKQLESGMILASDVTNLDGQTLFQSGTKLTERHIEILLMWGIPHVRITGEDSEPAIELKHFDAKTVQLAQAQADQRFALVRSSHPAVDVIKSISVLEHAKLIKRAHSAE